MMKSTKRMKPGEFVVALAAVSAIVLAGLAGCESGSKPGAGAGTGSGEGIQARVIAIVAEHMGVAASEITRETSFVKDLKADELDVVELVMEFEDQFELSIPDQDAEKLRTVGQMIDYIKGRAK